MALGDMECAKIKRIVCCGVGSVQIQIEIQKG